MFSWRIINVWNTCLPRVHCCTWAGSVWDSKRRVLCVLFSVVLNSLLRFMSIRTVYSCRRRRRNIVGQFAELTSLCVGIAQSLWTPHIALSLNQASHTLLSVIYKRNVLFTFWAKNATREHCFRPIKRIWRAAYYLQHHYSCLANGLLVNRTID